MLLADERHDFIRTVYSDLASVDFAKLVAVHDEMVEGRHGQPAPRQERRATRSISTCATSARSSRCQVPVTLEQLKRGDRKAIRTAFDALYEQRYAHHSPDEPVEMVNIRLGADRQAAEAAVSRASRRRRAPRRPANAQAYFTSAEQAASLPRSIAAKSSAPAPQIAGPGADPGARHHHGAVRERPLPGRAVGRDDHHGRRRVMPAYATLDHRHARGDPQRAARRRQRDGGRPAAHLLQHDDLRGARLSAPRCSTPRAS